MMRFSADAATQDAQSLPFHVLAERTCYPNELAGGNQRPSTHGLIAPANHR